MNYIENDTTQKDIYVYLGNQCRLTPREAHAKNYALALNRSPHRYVRLECKGAKQEVKNGAGA
jgi:hypothetical protein